ncbi:MAG: hypothetical protein ACRCXB_25760 [Aeromonadaceae bacterium]
MILLTQEPDEQAVPPYVLPDHFKPALIGYQVVETDDRLYARAVYSTDKILTLLMEHEGMDADEAVDWFYFNIEGSYLGPASPIYVEEQPSWEE